MAQRDAVRVGRPGGEGQLADHNVDLGQAAAAVTAVAATVGAASFVGLVEAIFLSLVLIDGKNLFSRMQHLAIIILAFLAYKRAMLSCFHFFLLIL